MVRSGSRIDGLARNKDQMNPTAYPDPSGPLLRPKAAKKCQKLSKFVNSWLELAVEYLDFFNSKEAFQLACGQGARKYFLSTSGNFEGEK